LLFGSDAGKIYRCSSRLEREFKVAINSFPHLFCSTYIDFKKTQKAPF